MLKYERFIVGALDTNTYIFYSEKSRFCFIIDPADRSEALEKFIETNDLKPTKIILTHGHIDHCGGAKYLCEKYDITLGINKNDESLLFSKINSELQRELDLDAPPKPSFYIEDGDEIIYEDLQLKAIHTPGHSLGSICLIFKDTVFSGDTLFYGSIGRTDLPGGDFPTIKKSLDRLMTFPDNTLVLPGHGDSTSIGQEKKINPYL